MNTVYKQLDQSLMTLIPAANADRLGPTLTSGTGGWDAYEVWNRYIKEARQRRDAHALQKKR